MVMHRIDDLEDTVKKAAETSVDKPTGKLGAEPSFGAPFVFRSDGDGDEGGDRE